MINYPGTEFLTMMLGAGGLSEGVNQGRGYYG